MEHITANKETPKATKSNTPVFAKAIQKKLSVGSSNDAFETEADTVADKVMSGTQSLPNTAAHTGALVQKKCAACEEEEKVQRKPIAEGITPLIQRSSVKDSGASPAPSHVENGINSSQGRGSVMDNETKSFMENGFGADFSHVNIHTGNEAVQMSRDLNAQAFTVGNDIYFNEGKYSPGTDSGKHLLAHELTHTIQQSGAIDRKIQRVCGRTDRTATGFPDPYISHIDVNITNPASVRLTWSGTNTSAQPTGPLHGTIGNGAGTHNCNDTTVSNTADTNCTPKGNFTIERQACHLGGHTQAKNASYFHSGRGIAFHYWPSRPDCPASHGCVRMEMADSELIYDNVISEVTADRHGRAATTVTVDGTWENCTNYNRRLEQEKQQGQNEITREEPAEAVS
jgi:hypothetical protein